MRDYPNNNVLSSYVANNTTNATTNTATNFVLSATDNANIDFPTNNRGVFIVCSASGTVKLTVVNANGDTWNPLLSPAYVTLYGNEYRCITLSGFTQQLAHPIHESINLFTKSLSESFLEENGSTHQTIREINQELVNLCTPPYCDAQGAIGFAGKHHMQTIIDQGLLRKNPAEILETVKILRILYTATPSPAREESVEEMIKYITGIDNLRNWSHELDIVTFKNSSYRIASDLTRHIFGYLDLKDIAIMGLIVTSQALKPIHFDQTPTGAGDGSTNSVAPEEMEIAGVVLDNMHANDGL